MEDYVYRDMLDWFMCSDPWPDWVNETYILRYLNEQAEVRGYDSWVVAFHELPREDSG